MRTILILLALATALDAQGTAQKQPRPKARTAAAAAAAPAPTPQAKPRVELDTSYGPIVVELEPDLAPKTVANFLRYVKDGHYKGTIFHRVIKGFMIQGGGHRQDLSEKPTRGGIPNEAGEALKGGLKNTVGTLAMARTPDPHSASAQFFINTADNPSLDHREPTPDGYGYCAFGRVVEGMDVVRQIEGVRTGFKRGMQNVPEPPVLLKGARILPQP